MLELRSELEDRLEEVPELLLVPEPALLFLLGLELREELELELRLRLELEPELLEGEE